MATGKLRPKRRGGSRALTRSENMAAVRTRNTGPEVVLRRALWAAGLRGYRLHVALPGHPDITFSRQQVAVFVDGCFWHGCPLHYSAPATRAAFWAAKLRTNVLRDAEVDTALRTAGWHPLHVWQHELRDTDQVVERIRHTLGLPSPCRTSSRPDLNSATSLLTGGAQPWHRCTCGNDDAQVLEVTGHGSIRPDARHRVTGVTLRCRACGTIWYAGSPGS
ncbi:very short patch repair endonuclease [Sorangium sp. So ce448]|uniref:very short patch repair endonuclease n=1 Tax=Sorangium sp. So ce448 TaxID=3133314 RepID=UPI003F5F30BB